MDAVIHLFPITVKLTGLIARTLPHASVMTFAILEMTAVMIFLKLDVLVSHAGNYQCHISSKERKNSVTGSRIQQLFAYS